MTTLTVYAEDGGYLDQETDNSTFATLRGGAGNDHYHTNATTGLISSTTTDRFYWLYRGGHVFDTSALTNNVIVTLATFSLKQLSDIHNGLGDASVNITAWSPSDPNDIVNGDYDAFSDTKFCDTDKTRATLASDYSGSAYSDWSFNSSGKAYINKTGHTSLFSRITWDISNSFGGSWASYVGSYYTFHSYVTSGTTSDPKLYLEYANAKTLSVTESSVLTLRRKTGKPFAITTTISKSLRRKITKLPLTVTEHSTVSHTKMKLSYKILAVTETAVRSLRRMVGKPLPKITESSVITLRRKVGVVRAVVETSLRTLQRKTGKILPKVTETATLSLRRGVGVVRAVVEHATTILKHPFPKNLSVTETAVVTVKKRVGLTRVVTESSTLLLRRRVGIIRAVTETGVRSLRRVIGKPLPKITGVFTSILRKRAGKTFTVVETSYALLSRRFSKTLTVVETSVILLRKRAGKQFVNTAHGTAVLRRRVGKQLAAITTLIFTKKIRLSKNISVTSHGLAAVSFNQQKYYKDLSVRMRSFTIMTRFYYQAKTASAGTIFGWGVIDDTVSRLR